LKAAAVANAGEQKRVLVVEDEPDIVDLLVVGLEAHGYAVSSAPTRDDALSIFREDLPDVILMDYRMPGLGAAEFLEDVRRKGTNTRVVLMSAEPAVRDVADKLGLEHALPKPFDYDALLKSVDIGGGI
jgi:two-component system, OmpR family, response regulator